MVILLIAPQDRRAGMNDVICPNSSMKTPPPFRRASLVLLMMVFALAASARAERTIAFAKNGTIYTASLDGKKTKKICEGADPCISPSGRCIVYTWTTEVKPTRNKPHQASGAPFTRSLRLRELATGKEQTLPTGEARQVYGASWSRDGQWIAFNLLLKEWQVAVIKPDGSGLKVLTKGERGHYLAGWNYKDNQLLVQNLEDMTQISPAGEVAWKKPVKEVIGQDSPSSALQCTISADGGFLVAAHSVLADEFANLDGPSFYLVLVRPPGGEVKRVTPKAFDVSAPWLDPAGEFVLFRGFEQKDVTPIKNSDGVDLKVRLYRFDLKTEQMTPLIEGGEQPSASQQ
jgi:TolB protein